MQALDDPEMELVAIAIRSGNVFGSLAASAGCAGKGLQAPVGCGATTVSDDARLL
jgi:hypothetical protein